MTQNVANDFEVASAVLEALKGKEKAAQERILKWVSESLGLVTPIPAPLPPVPIKVTPALQDTGAQPLVPFSDIKSFARSKNPSSDNQMAAVIAYYYRFLAPPSDRKETINSSVVSDAIRMIGGNQPTSPIKTLNNAKNQGYLDSAGTGEFKINSVGENLVVMTLGSTEDGLLNKRAAPRKKSKKKAAPKKTAKK